MTKNRGTGLPDTDNRGQSLGPERENSEVDPVDELYEGERAIVQIIAAIHFSDPGRVTAHRRTCAWLTTILTDTAVRRIRSTTPADCVLELTELLAHIGKWDPQQTYEFAKLAPRKLLYDLAWQIQDSKRWTPQQAHERQKRWTVLLQQ